ncbi:hypothetical protein NM688_g8228 [Phlebia brevispora]|uniref:Uncharacterized protein n=1 Tax=Phlebia brevispora TaxID=194682 RepID=A0ACC1RVQ2_9APHY|nr:hypothetical protein NM688_g8228 [Phlebia brevispora]
MPYIPQDVLYSITHHVTDPEDLKALSVTARDFTAPAQTYLFRKTAVTINQRRSLKNFTSFLQYTSSPIRTYIHALYLREGWTLDNRQTTLTQDDVRKIIDLLLSLKDLTLDQFEWIPHSTSELIEYTHSELKIISLRDIHTSSHRESPLEVLRFARNWDRVHIFDLQHRLVVPSIRLSPFSARTVILDHCPLYATNSDLLGAERPLLTGIETLLMQDTVTTQTGLLKQLIKSSLETLQRLSIELCPARRSTYLFDHILILC